MSTHMTVYADITEIRKFLKGIQQLSWDINAIEKRYPIEKISEEDLPVLLDMYKGLRDRLISLAIGANDSEPI